MQSISFVLLMIRNTRTDGAMVRTSVPTLEFLFFEVLVRFIAMEQT